MMSKKLKLILMTSFLLILVITISACDMADDNFGQDDEIIEEVSEFEILVLEESTEEPLEDVEVSLANESIETNSSGVATFQKVSTGYQQLEIVDIPAREDYVKEIEVNYDTSPYNANLTVSISLNEIPESIIGESDTESQSQNIEAQWVGDEHNYEVLKHVLLRSVVYMNSIFVDELNDWIEDKIDLILDWEGNDPEIELPQVFRLDEEKLGKIESEFNSNVVVFSEHISSLPVVEYNDYLIEASNEIDGVYQEVYDNRYNIENEEGSRGILYASDDYSRINLMNFYKLEDTNASSLGEDEEFDNIYPYQVIHDETEGFTYLITGDTMMAIHDIDGELIYEYINLEHGGNPHAAKFLGYEIDGQMTAGVYYKATEMHGINDYEFDKEDFNQVKNSDDPTEQSFQIFGHSDGVESFPIYGDEDHDFSVRDEFESGEYPDIEDIESIHENMISFNYINDLQFDFDEFKYIGDSMLERLGLYGL